MGTSAIFHALTNRYIILNSLIHKNFSLQINRTVLTNFFSSPSTEAVIRPDGRLPDSPAGRQILSEPRPPPLGKRPLLADMSRRGCRHGREADPSRSNYIPKLPSPPRDPERPICLRIWRLDPTGPRHELILQISSKRYPARAQTDKKGEEREAEEIMVAPHCPGRDQCWDHRHKTGFGQPARAGTGDFRRSHRNGAGVVETV